MGAFGAFQIGWSQSFRKWSAWLPLYLVNLALAVLMSLPLYLWLAERLDTRPWADQLLSLYPLNLNLPVDLLGAFIAGTIEGANMPAAQLSIPLIVGLLLQGLAYAFLSGGYLEALLGRESYWRGCRRWFIPFAGLTLLLFGISSFFLVVGFAVIILGGVQADSVVIGVTIAAFGYLLAYGTGEYARIAMVADERRNPLYGISRGLGFIFGHIGSVSGLGILLLLIAVVIIIAGNVLTFAVPAAAVWLSIIAGQIRAVIDIWYKALRLSTQLALYRGKQVEALPTERKVQQVEPVTFTR